MTSKEFEQARSDRDAKIVHLCLEMTDANLATLEAIRLGQDATELKQKANNIRAQIRLEEQEYEVFVKEWRPKIQD